MCIYICIYNGYIATRIISNTTGKNIFATSHSQSTPQFFLCLLCVFVSPTTRSHYTGDHTLSNFTKCTHSEYTVT